MSCRGPGIPAALRGVVIVAALLVVLAGVPASALDARLKWFGSQALLPDSDLLRQARGTPHFSDSLDLRLMQGFDTGRFRWLVHHSTTLLRATTFAELDGAGPTLDQAADSDSRRLLDLTWELESGSRHVLLHRVDRLSLRYRGEGWSATLGRDAVSWGNGLVFHPLDLFNPFAPTTVDQDYKAGDDLLLLEKRLAEGGGLQLLAVARRDRDGDITARAGSAAVKWHRFLGANEIEFVAARHYRDRVFAVSLQAPAGGALVRADLVTTRLDAGDTRVSGVVNVDYSLVAAARNLYVFAEYFHNGFGVGRIPDALQEYPERLLTRLERGELFNLQRDYLAAGVRVEWHPLWNQSLTLLGNLHDGSSLLQSQLDYDASDHQRVQFGLVHALGGSGDEYGGIPVAAGLTTGGGTRLYLRWVYHL